jgi:hypothetical protein
VTTWTSTDGSTWTSAGHPGPTGLQGDVRSFAAGIARLGDSLLVAGEDVNGQGEQFGWYAWMATIQD